MARPDVLQALLLLTVRGACAPLQAGARSSTRSRTSHALAFATQAAARRASLQGNPQVLQQLMACLADFDQYFEIMPGTKTVVASPSSP